MLFVKSLIASPETYWNTCEGGISQTANKALHRNFATLLSAKSRELIRYVNETSRRCILFFLKGEYEQIEMATAKDELKTLLEQQPEDSTSEELVRELAFHVMIQRGLADSDAGRTSSNEEVDRRIRSWAS